MNETLIIGLIVVAVLAVTGLGIKIALTYKGKNKTNYSVKMNNITAGGDVVGRDKNK
ncbi:MAG: hypothetical protein PHH11_18640 [Methylomonas sp.]|nr:hypothetical protein [Methylomonas sp.]